MKNIELNTEQKELIEEMVYHVFGHDISFCFFIDNKDLLISNDHLSKNNRSVYWYDLLTESIFLKLYNGHYSQMVRNMDISIQYNVLTKFLMNVLQRCKKEIFAV